MSIQSEIERISGNISAAYDAVGEMGGTLPAVRTSEYLADAVRTIAAVPAGIVVMWSGAANDVPDGWALCDGTNGTPDLRGRFVFGANAGHPAGETGGEETVTLAIGEIPAHSHTINSGNAMGYIDTIFLPTALTTAGMVMGSFEPTPTPHLNSTINSTGGGQAHNNMPPYYVLAYIMKL